jgi:putative ABC transport system ATP-binding protein
VTDPLFSCEHVTRSLVSGQGTVIAVHDVTCSAEPGARIAVMGPSGAGKSTLLHLIAGLDVPTRGAVTWPGLGGRPADDPGLVGVVFQGPSLIPALTAQENVALPLILRGARHESAQVAALATMERLGISAFANQLPDELSGGQAQRVAVARVLTLRPRLILADEPTGQLDHQAAATVVDALLAAAGELDAGLVIATHDPAVSRRLSTFWRMRDGSLEVLTQLAAGVR